MEFEEMQLIWDSQNNEKLYAINEAALHKQIRKKSQSAERKVIRFEWVLIIANLFAATILTIDTILDGDGLEKLIIATIYGAFGIFGIFRRVYRQREIKQFDQTVIGELDKAIWQVDYLIQQSKLLLKWYLPPIIFLFVLFDLIEGNMGWGTLFMVIVFIAGYFGGKWETNKWYVPKKRELEALRETLLQE